METAYLACQSLRLASVRLINSDAVSNESILFTIVEIRLREGGKTLNLAIMEAKVLSLCYISEAAQIAPLF